MELIIEVDDPRRDDVAALVDAHLHFARSTTPLDQVFAPDIESLRADDMTLYSARRNGVLLAIGALKQLEAAHGELKSMHVALASRGSGVGRSMVREIVGIASSRRYRRVSLVTGSGDSFAPARRLYESAGFEYCRAFDPYEADPATIFMTLVLSDPPIG